jgi:hemerythrin-like metal-binding protein
MDDQHGILMDTMNDLSMALVRGCGRERVTELLDRLTEFTRMHFFSEEQLLRQTGFPALDEHCTEHQRLLRKLRGRRPSRTTWRGRADATADVHAARWIPRTH